jgi:hypothetical protein
MRFANESGDESAAAMGVSFGLQVSSPVVSEPLTAPTDRFRSGLEAGARGNLLTA